MPVGVGTAKNSRGSSVRWVVALVVLYSCVLPRSALASFGPWNWVYKTCHASFADTVASAAGMMLGLPVAGVCGVALLPADIVHEIRQPQAKFFHYSNELCVYPSGVVGGGAYLAVGAPFYAIQWLVWDLPHGSCPPHPNQPPAPPKVEPAGEAP